MLIKMSGCSPSTDVMHDMRSRVIRRVLRAHQSPIRDNRVGQTVHLRCRLTHNSVWLHSQALAHWEIKPSSRRVRGTQQTLTGGPGCRGSHSRSACSGKKSFQTAAAPRPHRPAGCGGRRSPSRWYGTGSFMMALWHCSSLLCLHSC